MRRGENGGGAAPAPLPTAPSGVVRTRTGLNDATATVCPRPTAPRALVVARNGIVRVAKGLSGLSNGAVSFTPGGNFNVGMVDGGATTPVVSPSVVDGLVVPGTWTLGTAGCVFFLPCLSCAAAATGQAAIDKDTAKQSPRRIGP